MKNSLRFAKRYTYAHPILRALIVAKLTVIVLIAGLPLTASASGQEKITLNLRQVEITRILATIEKQGTYRFLYNSQLTALRQKITIEVTDSGINEVMVRILKGTNLSYKILPGNLVVITAGTGSRQDIRISGKVTNQNGEPLSGVSITVKGSSTGTSTDNNGNYALTVPEDTTLVISYIGYERQEIAVGGRTTIDIRLVPSNQQMEQVVVVGYGVQRKRDLTGAVSSVKGAEIARQPVQTATQAIQGRVAGVQIISSGAPNALPAVRIRGTGTMLGGANPLYVVDGVITDDIRNINSADIVSMDILKDASATAIYGMRAANGVLLITTKKGRSGKMVFAYDASAGVREPTNLVKMAGANEYAGYLNEASIYYGSGDSLVPSSRLNGTNTNWFDAILRRGFMQNHNLSVSGGSDRITYFLSAGYIGEQGIIENNKFNRFTLRSNNEYKLSNTLRLSTLVSYSRADLNDVSTDVLNNAYRAAPTVPAKVGNKYGNTSSAGNVGNPLLQLDKAYNRGLDNRLQGTFVLEYKPITWLTLRSSMGVDLDFYRNTNYAYRFFSDTTTFIEAGGNQQRGNSSLGITSNEASKWIWDNTATFAKRFDKHNISLLAGITSEQYRFNSLVGTRRDVPENRDQWFLATGTTEGATNNNTGDKWTRNSYISRLNYAYNDRYLLTVTMRADGTSRFSSNNRWGYFPSVGVGWNLSDEQFMQNQHTFDNLKLRGSWGRVGNDNIATSLYYTLASLNIPYYFGGNYFEGIAFRDINDPNIKWEVTEEFDLGLEFTTLGRRLSGELDFYHKKTNDALVEVNIAGILPDQNNVFITNAASFVNKGVELSLNWQDKINKAWSYTVGGNISYNKNEIVGLNGGQALFAGSVSGQGYTTRSDNGQPIGSFYLLEAAGIFQNAAEIAASAQKDARPGDIRYKDVSGPAGKPDGRIDELDRTYQGAYLPKVTYGISATVNYQAFDLSINTYGTAGGKIYNGKKATRGTDPRDNIEAAVAEQRWTPNKPNTAVPRANLNQLPASTYFLEKGDFFRINNLTIGYNLPSTWINRAKLNSWRVYITAQNMLTITPYTGFTPELLPTGDRPTLNAGIEYNSYPTTRTWAFGVNVGF